LLQILPKRDIWLFSPSTPTIKRALPTSKFHVQMQLPRITGRETQIQVVI